MKYIYIDFRSTILFLFLSFLVTSNCFSQTRLIFNGGYLVMDGGTNITPIFMVIENTNINALTRLSGGHIHSENQYNYVKWITAATTGNYLFPFGIGGNTSDYIPFTFNKTLGNSSIMMSTWATDTQNLPKPAATNVGAVTNMFGTADSVLYAIDRFWDIQTSAPTTADLTFSYRGSENTTSSPTNLVMAQHWNGTSWDTPVGPGTTGVTTGIGTAGAFIGQNTFSPWVLITICPKDSSTQNPIICQGDSVVVGTSVYTTTGTFIDTLTNIQGCDSIITTNLTVNPTTTGIDVQTACNNYTWIDGNNYTASNNTATFNIVGGAANGCDSIVTLNLTINNSTTGTDVQTTCNSYTWIDGNNYTTSTNTPTFTIVGGSSQGCDSVVTLNLTINTFASGTDVQTACNSYTWIDGNNYTASTNTPTYTYVGGSSQGCDSIVTLNLTINNSTTGTDVQTACNSYTWIDGNNYTTSTNIPSFTIVGGSSQGCDSVVTLNLTINTFASGTDLQTACNSYTWIDGNNYTASTNIPTYTIAGGSVQGCDSIVTLNLTINTFASGTDVITSCTPITWIDGNNYTASTNTPTYTIVGGSVQGCDSVVTLNLTVINVNAVINATPTTGSTPLNVFFGNGSTTGMSSNWDFGNGTSNTLFESTQTYNNPGVYTVILIVSNGVCYDTAMVVITTDVRIKVPSGFTPNGDGINDALVIEGIDQFPDNKLIIYNRWGSIVFSAQPYKNNWKGQSEGKAILIGNSVTEGTFFYLLEIDKETKPLTGFIEIKTK